MIGDTNTHIYVQRLVAELARTWLNEAHLHEEAAAEHDDEERDMHEGAARVYRSCANQLRETFR